jgi:hypothetical protein
MWQPLLTVALAGVVAVVALAFWAEIQNWMANVINRAQSVLGPMTHVLQSALVVLDKIMVNGQRMISVTGRTEFIDKVTNTKVTHEEVRKMDPQALPSDIRAKLDRGDTLTYDVKQ